MENFEKIIEEPIHGKKFYTDQNIVLLKKNLVEIQNKLQIGNFNNKKKIEVILEFVKQNVSYKRSYFDCFNGKIEKFDFNDVKYRTAYGALVEGEAMCAGYAETIRILLSLYNIKSYTILSKLPLKRKKLLHYVVVAECNDYSNKYIVLDPESLQYCLKNNINYNEYKEKCIYIAPNTIFTNNVLGKDGGGMLAEEYLNNTEIPRIYGTKNIEELINKINL